MSPREPPESISSGLKLANDEANCISSRVGEGSGAVASPSSRPLSIFKTLLLPKELCTLTEFRGAQVRHLNDILHGLPLAPRVLIRRHIYPIGFIRALERIPAYSPSLKGPLIGAFAR